MIILPSQFVGGNFFFVILRSNTNGLSFRRKREGFALSSLINVVDVLFMVDKVNKEREKL